jgi:hypothetical protein
MIVAPPTKCSMSGVAAAHAEEASMSEQWQYQLRIGVPEAVGATLRSDPGDPLLADLAVILRRHDAAAVCQYDAFAGYCAEAEREGIERYPLYAWTKATIADPVKKAKYLRSFTLYVGGEQVYAKAAADALEADLRPLLGGGVVDRLHKYDTNPANNPQPPARQRN